MDDGDTQKYHVSSLIQGFVFSSRKMGCIRCISSQVYINRKYSLLLRCLVKPQLHINDFGHGRATIHPDLSRLDAWARVVAAP